MSTKFLRRTWKRYSKLGRKRKKKQTWRKPRGRDNKMREKRRGYASIVKIGFKNKKEKSLGKIVRVNRLEDLKGLKRGQKILLGKMGKKKKIEILKQGEKQNLVFEKINAKKFLKSHEKNKEKENKK